MGKDGVEIVEECMDGIVSLFFFVNSCLRVGELVLVYFCGGIGIAKENEGMSNALNLFSDVDIIVVVSLRM